MYTEFTKEEIASVDNMVASFFQRNQINMLANIDVIQTCSQLGFNVISLSLPKGIDGVIVVEKDEKTIGVSNCIEPIEARFVVAHELAHYIHKLEEKKENENLLFATKDSVLHDEPKGETENLMDLTAAAILIPKDIFLRDLKERDISKVSSLKETYNIAIGKIEELAKRYNVSTKMVMRRIFEVSCYDS